MNKSELVSAVISAQQEQGNKMPKGEVEKVVNSTLEVIRDAVKKGDKVGILGFGSFSKERRAERNGVNPSSGMKLVIPAKDVVKFKSSKDFLA